MALTSHLWVLIHKHQSELQALGPVATLVAASVAAGVTVYFGIAQKRINEGQRQIAASQRDIAASQRDITKMRVRMDLHEKRSEVMRAARELMNEVLDREPDKLRIVQLRRTLSQCRFLFPSHIADMTDQMDVACVHASVLGQVTNPSQETIDKAHEAQMRVARFIDQWPAPFAEVMAFKDVE